MFVRIALLAALLVALAFPVAGSGQPVASAQSAPAAYSLRPAELIDQIITVIDSASVPANSFYPHRVLCPVGMVALGGGVDVENVITMIVTSSGPTFPGSSARLLAQPNGAGPAPIGWQASARNTAASPQTMRVGVICANLPGVTTVIGSGNAPAGSFGIGLAICPAGSVATGGGIDLGNVLTMEVSSSAPSYSGSRLYFQPDGAAGAPNGWRGSAVNSGGTSNTLKVGAICAPIDGVSSVISSDTASPGSFASERSVCPAGLVSTGGGLDPENVFYMRITSTAPSFGGSTARLYQQADGTTAAPSGWQASAINQYSEPRTIKNAAICVQTAEHVYLPIIARP